MSNSYKQSFKASSPDPFSLSIYNSGLQRCDAGYTWGPGMRDHYLIHLVVSGGGSFAVNGKEHALQAGDLFFARPRQLIHYTADSHAPWEYYWVGYNGAFASHFLPYLPFADNAPFFHLKEVEFAKECLHNIYAASGPSLPQQAKMTGYLYLFLSLLMQEGGERKLPLSTSAQYADIAIRFVQRNYSQEITVDDIAKAAGISRSHLYRVFMQVTGRSPVDYLADFRMGEACQLLEGSALSVAEVAYSVGFLDPFYFSRVFKKLKGVPPSRYQRAGNLPK